MEENRMLKAARGYVEKGWSVLPLRPKEKTPGRAWKEFQNRRPSLEELDSWYAEEPTANLGIVTGAISGIVAVDIDSADGEEWIGNLLAGASTLESRSHRGKHLIFKHPGTQVPTKAAISAGVDVRGDGGYIVAPPSVHPSGDRYSWSNRAPIAELPAALLELLNPDKEESQPIEEGCRNATLARIAGSLYGRGLTLEQVQQDLHEINLDRCVPPLPASEVDKVARSIGNRDRTKRAHLPVARRSLTATTLAGVQPVKVSWLWPGYVPYGKLVVLDGDPGVGKSSVTLDLAARLSTGSPMPDGSACAACDVLLVSREDGVADTVVPRLAASGADLSRLHSINEPLELPTDIRQLLELTTSHNARLVIIDPLSACYATRINSWNEQQVRQALAPLADMAAETGAAVIVVRHLNKKTGLAAIHRGGGSNAVGAQARSALLVAKDPAAPADRSILAPVKSNICKAPSSLAFTISEAENGASRINWLGHCDYSCEDLVAIPSVPARPRAHAAAFVLEALQNGSVSSQVLQQGAVEAGISLKTLERAKIEVGARSKKIGIGAGSHWITYRDPDGSSKS